MRKKEQENVVLIGDNAESDFTNYFFTLTDLYEFHRERGLHIDFTEKTIINALMMTLLEFSRVSYH